MNKYYIGFGIVTLAVIAVVGYALVDLHVHPYVSPVEQAQNSSRDARRLADVRQIQTALELYYNDCGDYPSALTLTENRGCPAGYNFGYYMSTIPVNPTPGGMTYTYSSSGPDAYSLMFSLDGAISGFEAGTHTASQNGIE